MFFLVSLKVANKTTIVVPWKWIRQVDIIKLLNYGVLYKKKTEVLVYFSKNMQEEPDFNCATLNTFDSHHTACYCASIIRGFGKYYILSVSFSILKSHSSFHNQIFIFSRIRQPHSGYATFESLVSRTLHAAIWR